MKVLIIFISVIIIIILIHSCVLDNKIQILEYKNVTLHLMIDDVINYADSTADTGEFDEFIVSHQGERFFANYCEIYDK